jgi:hypothetical protein
MGIWELVNESMSRLAISDDNEKSRHLPEADDGFSHF